MIWIQPSQLSAEIKNKNSVHLKRQSYKEGNWQSLLVPVTLSSFNRHLIDIFLKSTMLPHEDQDFEIKHILIY